MLDVLIVESLDFLQADFFPPDMPWVFAAGAPAWGTASHLSS